MLPRPGQQALRLRLIRVKKQAGDGARVYLLTNVFDRRRLSDETAAAWYRMCWGVEVFYRHYEQALEQRKLRSDVSEQAERELDWGMTMLLLLGLMSVGPIIQEGRDPLSLSVAGALRIVRRAMHTPRRWRRRGDLRVRLAAAIKEGYPCHGCKKARDWPHKNESPPGIPKTRAAT